MQCHLHDPGRLPDIFSRKREILLLERDGRRKTKYDVIAARMEKEWVFIHSGYHSIFAEHIIENHLLDELSIFRVGRREYRYGKSRIDFLLVNKRHALLEVKGCTLARNGIALFPDAPTERGRRHIIELMNSMDDGYLAYILFLVMRNAERFSPNKEIDPEFASLIIEGMERGLGVMAARLKFDGKNVYYAGRIPVC